LNFVSAFCILPSAFSIYGFALQNRHGVMEIMTNDGDLSIPFVFNGFRDYRRNTFPTGDKRPSGAKPERFQTVLAVKPRQTV
jgi:hypothetical protein